MTRIITILLLLSAHLLLTQSAVVFQATQAFAAIQTRLTTTSGFIPSTTGTSFSLANPGYYNFNSLGLALCGYDMKPQSNIQFKIQLSYDSTGNYFIFLLQPINGTSFYSLNYYLLITNTVASSYMQIQDICLYPNFVLTNPTVYNRTYTYQIRAPFTFSSSVNIGIYPYLKTINAISFGVYNYYNITAIVPSSGANTLQVIVFLNYSMVSEVCLTILYYHKNIASANSLYYNASDAFRQPLMANTNYTLANVALNNFGMDGIYGPNYQPKCVVGLQTITLDINLRQTLSFNMTGSAVFNLLASAFYKAEYGFFCLAEIFCSSPSQQYYPLLDACQPICTLTNCSVCSTSTSCSTCNPGSYLNALYRCNPCMTSCDVCTDSTSCTTCSNGTFYNSTSKSCPNCPQFCLRCTSTICQSCQTGYIPSGNQCVKCSLIMNQCLQCTSSAYCSLCPNNTFYQNSIYGCVNCSSVYAGCLTCANQLRCYTCLTGYYLNSHMVCAGCVISVASCCPYFVNNCVSCLSNKTCRDCQIGYYLSNSSQCLLCENSIANCTACVNSTNCTACASGFYLVNGSCSVCGQALSDCLTCQNASFCLTCGGSFLPVLGICTDCPIWPLNQIYYLDSNSICQPCTSVTPNCTRCLSSTLCTQCTQLTYLFGSACLPCSSAIPNCLGCKNSSSCLVCLEGYYPTMTNTSQCLLCNQTIPNCLACIQSYLPSSNDYLLECLNCQPEYYVNGSQCSPCNESLSFCLVCTNNYQCGNCQQGYYLSSTLTCIDCPSIIQGCIQCSSTSTCTQCELGYYLASSYCSLCLLAIPNCYSCSTINTTLICASCSSGYYLTVNSTCLNCNNSIKFCTACLNISYCSNCISGYLARGGICVTCASILPYCLYCPGYSCLQCMDNYLLDELSRQCMPCSYYLAGCSTCGNIVDSTNVTKLNCSSCMTAYVIYLSNTTNFTSCLSCNSSLLHCASCTNLSACITCSPGAFLNSLKTCSLCSLSLPNCLTCNNYNVCTGCQSSYYLAANGSCVLCNTSSFGQYQQNDICLQCIYVGNSSNCTSCIQGYYLSNGNCSSCSNTMKNCKICTGSSVCVECMDYYYLSSSNSQCLPCASSLTLCTSCNANNICLSCHLSAFLDTTANKCTSCDTITTNCLSCQPNVTANISLVSCSSCKDGYYLLGVECFSCESAMKDCVLCSNATNCQVSNNYVNQGSQGGLKNLPFWVYLAIMIAGICVLLICIICLVRRRRKQQQNQSNKPTTPEQSQTQRQLVDEHLMSSQQTQKPLMLSKQKCHYCNKFAPNSMNFQLLCGVCSKKQRRGHDHKIRQELQGDKMENVMSSQKEGLQPPPSSMINKEQQEIQGDNREQPRTWSEYREQYDVRKKTTYHSAQPR